MIKIQEGCKYRIVPQALSIGKVNFKQDEIIFVEKMEGLYCYIERLIDNTKLKIETIALKLTCEKVVE